MRFPAVLPVLLLFLALAVLRAQSPVVVAAPAVDVQEIVRRAIANDELRRQHRLALECDQIITTERLDESGQRLQNQDGPRRSTREPGLRLFRRRGSHPAAATTARTATPPRPSTYWP